MANRTSNHPIGRRSVGAMVLAALSSMMHRDKPVRISPDVGTGRRARHEGPRLNWLKANLISERGHAGARGG